MLLARTQICEYKNIELMAVETDPFHFEAILVQC